MGEGGRGWKRVRERVRERVGGWKHRIEVDDGVALEKTRGSCSSANGEQVGGNNSLAPLAYPTTAASTERERCTMQQMEPGKKKKKPTSATEREGKGGRERETCS